MGRRARTLVSLALVASPWLTGTALAVSTCAWDPDPATLTVVADAEATLAVSGAQITLNGTPCDAGATTSTVDLIDVSGGAGDDDLTVDLSGGVFAPGAEVESTGISEIEFAVALGGGADELAVVGTSSQDVISIGERGANLDDDDDIDVTTAGIESISLLGGNGGDDLSAGGDAVVGEPLAIQASIDGGQGIDALLGGDGGDVLAGGPDDDTMDGGAGTDEVTFVGSTDTENVYLAMRTAFGGEGVDTIDRIEDVTGSPFPDLIIGDDSANRLHGGEANDVINGSGAGDVITGDAGLDTAAFFGSPSPVTVNLGLGTATGWGSDSLGTMENLHGSNHADVLTGNGGANIISGSGGNDVIRGGPGSDHLFGNRGNDRVQPGTGADEAKGGPGVDTIDLSTATHGVTINLASGTTMGQGTDVIAGFERAKGSASADLIAGSAAANLLNGAAGEDRLSGAGRADRLVGGSGRDTLNGGGGADILVGGLHHDVANGGGGNDTLSGGAGPDLLHGNAGDDAFNGGAGIDTCHQDAGKGPKSSCERPR
jgi:Ca2+-binding RTX toxin-like protein